MKKIIKIVEDLLFIAVLGMLCSMFYSIHVSGTVAVFDYHFMRIISNSMSPTLTPNTCIIVKEVPEEELSVGDVITFVSHDARINGFYNTHRIYGITYEEETGKRLFITKGDFFDVPDDTYVAYEDVMGRFVRKMPFSRLISFLVDKLSNSRIYFMVVLLPLILCFLSYIYELIQLLVFGFETEEEQKARKQLRKQEKRERRQQRKRHKKETETGEAKRILKK